MRILSLPLFLMLVPSVDAGRLTSGKPAASEVPALEKILRSGNWEPTPEMSGRYAVGTILDTSTGDHRIMAANCFEQKALVAPYVGAEVVASMQAGVSMPLGRGKAGGELVKKVKFGTPTTESLERLYMKLTPTCSQLLGELPPENLAQMYIVQEVLKADIAEQTCGSLDASGRIVGLGSVDASFSQACSMESLEPIAVGYRTLPLAELLPKELRAEVLAVAAISAEADAPVAPSRRLERPAKKDERAKAPAEPAPKPEAVKASTPSASGNARTTPGTHWGAFVGLDNGLRAQIRPGDGRNGFGVRVGVGVGVGSSLAAWYSDPDNWAEQFSGAVPPTPTPIQVGGALEWERRADASSPSALLLSVGGGWQSVFFGGGVGWLRDIGDSNGHFEAELFAGAFGVAPRVAYGWMW